MLESVGADDHAIVTVPNYQSLESVTLSTGAEVSPLRLRVEDDGADRRPRRRLIASRAR